MQFDCECGLATAYEDPPECPECGRKMKHLRLEVLEREHSEFFERWHEERLKREALETALYLIAEGKVMRETPFTHADTALKYQEIARDAIAKVGAGGTADGGTKGT